MIEELTAKYKSKCVDCGALINPGDRIKYEKGDGSWHFECENAPLPENTIWLSGGEGYGCDGWQAGQVVVGDSNKSKPGAEFLYVLRASQQYYREDGLCFGVGDEQGYVFSAACRPATEEEAAPLKAVIAENERRRKAEVTRKAIAKLIRETGTFPESANPSGLVVTDRQNIYGGGNWFIVGSDKIWYVQNNGHDGDDWSCNNIGTGGAGAIGWFVEKTPELVEQIFDFEKVLDAEKIAKRNRDAATPSEQLRYYLTKRRENFPAAVAEIDLFNEPIAGKHEPVNGVYVKVNDFFMLAQTADKTKITLAATNVDDVPHGWFVKGNSAASFTFETTAAQQSLFDSLVPEWAEWELAAAMLGNSYNQNQENISKTGTLGRFHSPRRGFRPSWMSTAKDAINEALLDNFGINEIEFTPDVRLLHVHGKDSYSDGQWQLWSDGVSTRGAFAGPRISTLNTDVSFLMSVALSGGGEWKNGCWKELLKVESITERKTLKNQDNRNNSNLLEEITVHTTLQDTIMLYLVSKTWWYLGEDGDAGEDLYLYRQKGDALRKFSD